MNPLALSGPEYKAVFEHITQLALEYLSSLDQRPIFPAVSGSEIEALFRKPLLEQGVGIEALAGLATVVENVRAGGPRFFGYVLGSGEPVAAAADLQAKSRSLDSRRDRARCGRGNTVRGARSG